jgi:hypothetical protein
MNPKGRALTHSALGIPHSALPIPLSHQMGEGRGEGCPFPHSALRTSHSALSPRHA